MKIDELLELTKTAISNIETDSEGDSEEFKKGRIYGAKCALIDLSSHLLGCTDSDILEAIGHVIFNQNENS
jgi:hypothetical protein